MFALIRRTPRFDFPSLDSAWGHMVDSLFSDSLPVRAGLNPLDYPAETEVFSKDDKLVYRVALPGVDQKDIDLSVEDNVLTIKAERKQPHEVKEKDWHAKGFSYGRFEQSWSLPKGVKTDEVSAQLKNGVLEIHVPKAAPAIAKKIEVKQLEAPKAA
jgi:HSP20 family protein